MKKRWISIGTLLVALVAVSVVYIQLEGAGVQIRIDAGGAHYYINESGRFVMSGVEGSRLFNGSTIQWRNRSSIKITNETNGDLLTYIRTTDYYKAPRVYRPGPRIVERWTFNTSSGDVIQFPVHHEVCVYNGSGLFYRYSVDKLTGTGKRRSYNNTTTFQFGRKMFVQIEPGYRWMWVGWPYGSDSMAAQYDVTSNDWCGDFRLFDPPTKVSLSFGNLNSTRSIEHGSPVNVSANVTPDALEVCLSADSGDLGDNFTCGIGSVSYVWNGKTGYRHFSDGSLAKNFTSSSFSDNVTSIKNDSAVTSVGLGVYGYKAASIYPSDVVVGLSRSNVTLRGTLYGSNLVQDAFSNGSKSKAYDFTIGGINKTTIELTNLFNLTHASFNITGTDNGVQYSKDYYIQPSLYISQSASALREGTDVLYSFGGKCIDPGGCGSLAAYNLTFSYDIGDRKRSTYSDLANVPYNAGYGACAVYINDSSYFGSKGFLVVGGHDGVAAKDNAAFYNPSFDNWYIKANMPAARYDGACIADLGHHRVFYIDGLDSSDTPTDTIYEYNLSSNTWSTFGTDVYTRYGNSVEWYNSTHIAIFGSYEAGNGLAYHGRMSFIDTATNTVVNPLFGNGGDPQGWAEGSARIDGKIYVFGGVYAYSYIFQYSNRILVWNYTTDSWDQSSSVLDGTMFFRDCSEYNGRAVCLGQTKNVFGFAVEEISVVPWGVEVQAGNNVVSMYKQPGELITTESSGDKSAAFNGQLHNCTSVTNNTCTMDLYIINQGVGTVTIDALNFTTALTPFNITGANITCSNSLCEVKVVAKPSGGGIVELRNLSVRYNGDQAVTWTASTSGNATYGPASNTTVVSVFYSGYNYSLPSPYKFIEYAPRTSTSDNVTPRGQTSSSPILNITYDSSLTRNASFYFMINNTASCINTYVNTNGTKTGSTQLTDGSWVKLVDNKANGYNFGVWLWSDYNCTGSTWQLSEPNYYLRACAENAYCSKDVS